MMTMMTRTKFKKSLLKLCCSGTQYHTKQMQILKDDLLVQTLNTPIELIEIGKPSRIQCQLMVRHERRVFYLEEVRSCYISHVSALPADIGF